MENLKIALQNGLSNYATFSGRAGRPAFWWYVLAYVLIMLAVGLVENIIGFGGDRGQPLSMLVSLGFLLPNLAIGARRLHDSGRSGWWLLIALIPIVGFLVLLYFYIQPSDQGENAYGPQPGWPPAG